MVDVSLLVLYLVSEATQLFLMNLSVVLHLFLQGSLQNTQQEHIVFKYLPYKTSNITFE